MNRRFFFLREGLSADDLRGDHHAAFASDLQFPVGLIPTTIETDLGNGQPFLLQSRDDSQDISVYFYRQGNGQMTLTVYGD